MSILSVNSHIRSADAAIAEWARCTNFQMYVDLFYLDGDDVVYENRRIERDSKHETGKYKHLLKYCEFLPMPAPVFRDYLRTMGRDVPANVLDDHCYIPDETAEGFPTKLVNVENVRALVKFHMTEPV